jgi:hypothetical protein
MHKPPIFFFESYVCVSIQSRVTGIAFDGSDLLPVNHAVTTSKDGSVRVWDLNGLLLSSYLLHLHVAI